jgi:hypothetical protein
MLACTTAFENAALSVRGDDADNQIEIVAAPRGIAVTCDGQPAGPFRDVRAILVESGGGNDGLRFDAQPAQGAGGLQDTDGDAVPEIVDFRGGPGNDTIHIAASPAAALRLDGGQDADSYTIQFGRLLGTVRVNNSGTVSEDQLLLLGNRFAEQIQIEADGQQTWLARWEGPDRNGSANEVAIESLEIAHAGMKFVEVATSGGSDLVGLSDSQGNLRGSQWSINLGDGDNRFEAAVVELPVVVYAGRGSDVVDVRMAALPAHVRVLTGEGNDDISIVFADSPNAPPPPRQPGDPPPEVFVDVGAGVDSAFIDVFGSLVQPPSDLIGIRPQVTLSEVVASILIAGVGLLALLTLFPLGAMEMHQAIQDDRSGHAKTEAAITLEGANLGVDLTTGATADSIRLDVAAAATDELQQKVRIDSGAGNDVISVLLRRLANPSLQPRRVEQDLSITAGGGVDLVDVQLNVAASEALQQKVRVDAGLGNDIARMQLLPWLDRADDIDFPEDVQADLGIEMGGGSDRAEVELQTHASAEENCYSLQLGLGPGDDVARYWIFGTELPPAPKPTRPLGKLTVEVLGHAGHDDIAGRIGASRAGQLLPLALAETLIGMSGGSGKDRLSLDFQGPILAGAAVDAVLRGGAGNDQVHARFDLAPPSTGRLSAETHGDEGSDDLTLEILQADQLEPLFALLDGGRGRDRCRATGNVTVTNCP